MTDQREERERWQLRALEAEEERDRLEAQVARDTNHLARYLFSIAALESCLRGLERAAPEKWSKKLNEAKAKARELLGESDD